MRDPTWSLVPGVELAFSVPKALGYLLPSQRLVKGGPSLLPPAGAALGEVHLGWGWGGAQWAWPLTSPF